MKRFLIR
jgi:hypothetical protein